jgi:hypothetical protein
MGEYLYMREEVTRDWNNIYIYIYIYIYCLSDIVRVIKPRKLIWLKHVTATADV